MQIYLKKWYNKQVSFLLIYKKIQLKTADKVALEMVSSLNNASFFKNDLDEESYYIKSGYGQKTVDEINSEPREKFSSKSFNDLNLTLKPKDIVSYDYFFKEVEYKAEFKKEEVLFKGKKVAGFMPMVGNKEKI